MAQPESAFGETAKNAFDFYNTYLSVIYGLLATQGLTSVVDFTSKDDEQVWNLLSILLFAGIFLTVMRLWFNLANIDELTRRAYELAASSKHSKFNFLLMVDLVFATAFAGLSLAMFKAIPSEISLFGLFFWLGALYLLYDLFSGFLFYRLTKGIDETANCQEIVEKYKGKVRKWIKQDFGFATAATVLYFTALALKRDNSVTLASAFVLLAAVQLVVELFPHWGDVISKSSGRA